MKDLSQGSAIVPDLALGQPTAGFADWGWDFKIRSSGIYRVNYDVS